MTTSKGNFDFLQEHDPIFYQIGSAAERAFAGDPNTTLLKLRQLAEAMAQNIATRTGIEFDETVTQATLLFKLKNKIGLDQSIQNIFHILRIEGNRANHQFKTQHKEAMDGLRLARSLAIWFHQSFGKQGTNFEFGPFIPPQDPSKELRGLQIQIDQLTAELTDSNQELKNNQKLSDLITREKEEYAVLAEQMDAEARAFEQLATEHEKALKEQREEFEQRLKELQPKDIEQNQAKQQVSEKTQKATAAFSPNEDLTRILIDQQLINAGWEADTQEMTYKKGARPEKGKNKAISEWPTRGREVADYILFIGLTPIAVVEAKRINIDVAGKIHQAERYSSGFMPTAEMQLAWEIEKRTIAWPDSKNGHFQIPFAFSCNGRPFVKQYKEKSGTWFRDLREPSNLSRALEDFYSPDGLLDCLTRSREEAEEKLKNEGFAYLKLRDYQEKAIRKVEEALEKDTPDEELHKCLLAMATGTGKTRTIIGLMYRFLKTERFKRILFLVDRNALGTQAQDAFDEAPLEENKSLSTTYNIAELGDMAAEAETRIQVATVQAMVYRIFQSDNPPLIDTFDCIIIDEAHRGYTLDQEMTEGELAVRELSQYLSSYRRVLDHFDAVKVAMTATPAKHTTEIFGKPIYTYSYREAVADDWLIDHEPPIRYETLLTKHGIHFDEGETVSVVNIGTGEVEITELEDEQNFETEAFNRRVITKSFNEVICEQLAQELDPFADEKTLIFCATDSHADMVKTLLDSAFKKLYGNEYNEAAVRKITGSSEKVKQLIRQYKNERNPSIAITVDLLSTGIDVPKICHVVFLRRVRSRILYEQMMGRATRRCDEIGKTVFKIYDPVDIYAALQAVSTMKPLVKDPNVTIEQLIEELSDPKSYEAPGTQADTTHADDVLNELNQKVMRVLRKATKKAEKIPSIKEKLEELEQIWGVEPGKMHKHLHDMGPKQAGIFVNKQHNFIKQLDEVNALIGSDRKPIIYEGEDELLGRTQSYGTHEKPDDYLESFNDFILNQVNESVALAIVVNKPKDLSREQLKEVRLLLDQHGFSEAKLKTAWRNKTNQEIAASIIGYIRQAALGGTLVSFEQRVAHAMEGIYRLHNWSTVQRKWLEKLAKQLVHEVVIDKQFINDLPAFPGGVKQLEKVLNNQLDSVIEELKTHIWEAS